MGTVVLLWRSLLTKLRTHFQTTFLQSPLRRSQHTSTCLKGCHDSQGAVNVQYVPLHTQLSFDSEWGWGISFGAGNKPQPLRNSGEARRLYKNVCLCEIEATTNSTISHFEAITLESRFCLSRGTTKLVITTVFFLP